MKYVSGRSKISKKVDDLATRLRARPPVSVVVPRDAGQWEKMRSAYYPESIVRVAWFQGNGFEFVEASKGMHRQGQSKHRLSPTTVRRNGDRTLSETDTVIETRTLYGDIEVDTTANCRLFSRLRRDDCVWRLAGLHVI